ncbi:MAG: RNA 2',3'-cyclic phosphodiesterase [Nitrospirae bacterium]|uniref:RNA 2',3'-cyclic phosphodiesterase n=1 Tax=Candidatus Magnetobacterium casense TaxID=1455061 RepID=UPI000698EBEB|nr:RNA 2',3'-cyclic phosphodiesterase [Candidatus Magnetobacterium casensis]MBF0337103.1 RNA 2',3'-cyclic phosphodiesterase [Nitrospirota bacterium]
MPERVGVEGRRLKTRAFIAINIAEPVQLEIDAAIAPLRQDYRDVKWVRRENLHLTLKFLGDIDQGQVRRVEAALEGVCTLHRSFSIALRSVGGFPTLTRPKVLWIGVENDSAMRGLHRDIDARLSDAGFAREDKPWAAHLTIGRLRDGGNAIGLMEKLTSLKTQDFGLSPVSTIDFMSSELKPGGPIYSVMRKFPLKG